jgi:hypothetical protein
MELADIPELPHPAFPQPNDLSAIIWRYMDIDKFRSLVSTGRLYMARADLLGDDYEGTTPAAEKEHWRLLAEQALTDAERQIVEGNAQQLADFAATFRPAYYVSCWHMNQDENVAMWERYVKTPNSVAIKTTYDTLRQQLVPRQLINLGLVRYIDYDKHQLPSVNILQRITHKRHFFADEREVRAVICRIAPPEISSRYIDPLITSDERGFLQPIDAPSLIEGIVLNPKASTAFATEVTEICAAQNLPKPEFSRIAGTPVF